MSREKEKRMSTGETILMIGIILVVAAVLTLIIGEMVLSGQKRRVLRAIQREYR